MNKDPNQETHFVINVLLKAQAIAQTETEDTIIFIFCLNMCYCIYIRCIEDLQR